MSSSSSLDQHREAIRSHYLAPERDLARLMLAEANMTGPLRQSARDRAAAFVVEARSNAERSGLIDKFLQEYGLSTAEGVTLMRLAEALLRTPDAATANALIEDKIEAGDWASHKGKSPFPLVNFSTRALMLTAAWLDEHEAKDPLGRIAAATKSALDKFGEPVIRASVAQAMRIMGEHFVLGETIDEALRRGKKFADKGYTFSFDMLGEAALTQADADKFYNDYTQAIETIARAASGESVAENPGISVKLSALHPRYEINKRERVLAEMTPRLKSLAAKAHAANMGFNIDAEEADRLDISLDIIEALLRDNDLAGWDGFGVVVQAYQRRALFVIDWLADLARATGRRIMVRLVKGAYWDSEIKRAQVMGLESYPVFTRKALTDLSYVACAKKLISNSDVIYPQFATHNALTATTVQELAGDNVDYELQRLHGMGEALHDSLLTSGARSRIYAPVGGHRELLPYLVRRLLENGANSSFVNQLIDAELSVDDIIVDPVVEVRDLTVFANPKIPAPRDYLNGRLAALGFDETDPLTAKDFTPEAVKTHSEITARPIISGKLISGEQSPVVNPTNHTVQVGHVVQASDEDVQNACTAAASYAAEWATIPAASRSAILRNAADRLEDDAQHFMALCVAEAGKTWPDAIAEIREAVDFLRYYADQAETLAAEPLGVVACISPWNFPLAIFLGQVSAALAAGNCVICKPAEQTPLIAFEGVRLLLEAGIPEGALHFLPGDGQQVGAPLVKNENVAGVVFTGSTQTAQAINRSLRASGKFDAPLIAETGGVNAMIIDSTALLEQAVGDVIASAFQSAGQRCSACRLVCVQSDIADRFIDMLKGAMAELNVGDPALLETDVGPVIDEEARLNTEKEIEARGRNGKIVAQAPASATADGFFVTPTAIEINDIAEAAPEVFGPLLHVYRFDADDLLAVVDAVNALDYGLTMGVHSRIDETVQAIAGAARIGNIYVNRNQIGAVVGVQPFGGEGLSGTGPKAGGPHYLSALVKNGSTAPQSIFLNDGKTSESEARALNDAAAAYDDWHHCDRGRILDAAIAELSFGDQTQLKYAATLYKELFSSVSELPGPTGEYNSLKLAGRGVAVILGDTTDLIAPIFVALAAGNTIVAAGDAALQLKSALEKAGAPNGVVMIADAISIGLLRDDAVRLVVAPSVTSDLAIEAAKRDGPLIPILTPSDPPWRFAVERTLTINTTAAGGDVRLLSLAE